MAVPKEKIINKINSNNKINNSFSNSDNSLYLRKMFVGGLHPSLTTENLISYFSQFGEIEKGIIMTDKISGKSRGFGFIIFSHQETIDKIMSYSNCHFLYGKWIECKRAQPKNKNIKMLNDNDSFPNVNYKKSFNLSQNLIKFFKDNSNDNINDKNQSLLLNDDNLFLNQNYIPKEKIKLFNDADDNLNLDSVNSIDKNEDKSISLSQIKNRNTQDIFINKDLFKKKDVFQVEKKEKPNDYYNNSSSYNYFQYKLFDSNGEDFTKKVTYKNKTEKISLFPQENDISFEKNKKNNKDNIISNNINNKINNNILSNEIIENNSIENLIGNCNRIIKKEKLNCVYSNNSYNPY